MRSAASVVSRRWREEALISEAKRNASVLAATDVTVMRLGKEDFRKLLNEPMLHWVDMREALGIVARGGKWLDVRLPSEFEHHHLDGALNVPLYTGGFIDSKVREALALQESARQNVEVARRNALFNAQTGFTGVNSAAASVKAFEQALVSAQTAYESNKTGQEVGVRTNLDVLNTQQNVFQTRRDLAQAYFNYLVGILRLKAAVGSLDEQDLVDVNRRLRG